MEADANLEQDSQLQNLGELTNTFDPNFEKKLHLNIHGFVPITELENATKVGNNTRTLILNLTE